MARESNMELARIVAMLFVLLFHADFLSLGWPTSEDSIVQPGTTLFKLFVESLSVVCVDLFVLISGWFGIKPTIKKGTNLLCTTLFYSILIFFVFVIVQGKGAITMESVKNALLLNKGYWFIKCYLFLMIMSPMLNSFVESSSKQQFRTVLLVLLAFQCYFGWPDASYDYHHGYSSLLFVFLYLLARYVKIHQKEYSFGTKKYFLIYAFITVAMTLFSYAATRYSFIPSSLVWYSFNYLNPLVIVSALSLMLFFNSLHFTSKAVNWVASSALAVYLIHANEMVLPLYSDTIIRLSERNHSLLLICSFIAIVFVGSILIDKLRGLLFMKMRLK